ncbi:T9SS type A sorting domain-containing protein [Flavobacterium sp. RHBU_24]|uniref:T9SS type A sorting domain-containing protein n=1 Tax=Flavobacterium sp. RHBU_24 TaxID=3391185 RepID=UPI003984BAEE
MKKILLLTLLLPLAGIAQQFEWLRTPETVMPYNSDMVGYSTATDTDGNIYYTGFKDTAYMYTSIMGNQYFNKYSADGTLLFSKSINGQVQSYNMVTDSNGNVYMALGYVGDIILDNIGLITVSQGEQYLLVKFSPLGNLIWYQELIPEDMGEGWYNEIAEFSAMAMDAQDNVYIGYADFFKSYVKKFAPDGSVLQTIEQDNVRRVTSIAVDNENNIYAAGSCLDIGSDFNGTAVATDFTYSIYLAKYNASGENQWVKVVEDITCPEPAVVAKTPDAVYFCSYLNGPFAFDNLVPQEGGVSFEQFFLIKLNSGGEYQWLRQTPINSRFSLGNRNYLALDNDGNIFIGGRTSGTTNWGNGIITSILTYNLRGAVVKYNPQGTVQMAKIIGGSDTETSLTKFDNITVDNDGYIVGTGMGFGPTSFDAITYNPGQITGYYPFITKLSQTTAGINNVSGNAVVLYPNPVVNAFSIAGITGEVSGKIINTIGQAVLDFKAFPNEKVDISALPTGNYFVQVNNGKSIKINKI